MMIVHSVLIAVLLYVFMVFVLGQRPFVAENRSIFLGALVLAYMMLFGHGLPTSLHRGLF